MHLIEKVHVGDAATEAFVFDEIISEEGLHRVSLLHDHELGGERRTMLRTRPSFVLLSCESFAHHGSFPTGLEHCVK